MALHAANGERRQDGQVSLDKKNSTGQVSLVKKNVYASSPDLLKAAHNN